MADLVLRGLGGLLFQVAPGVSAYTVTDESAVRSKGGVQGYPLLGHGHYDDAAPYQDVETGPLTGCRWCRMGTPLLTVGVLKASD